MKREHEIKLGKLKKDGNPRALVAQEIGVHFLNLFHGMDNGSESVDMGNGSVSPFNHCGTTMCHGGWFEWLTAIKDCDNDYDDGAYKMAQMLGFYDYDLLEEWAGMNPKIWGNEEGGKIFGSSRAFMPPNSRDKRFISLEVIGKHWLEVSERLKLSK